jgi:DNA-binding MurR/RpiR family transcriptional regulator
VLVVGVGSSAALCQDAASRFTAIGLHAGAPANVHDQHLRARLLNAEEPMATRLAHLALLDSLVVAVAQRNEPRTRSALARHARPLGEHLG